MTPTVVGGEWERGLVYVFIISCVMCVFSSNNMDLGLDLLVVVLLVTSMVAGATNVQDGLRLGFEALLLEQGYEALSRVCLTSFFQFFPLEIGRAHV